MANTEQATIKFLLKRIAQQAEYINTTAIQYHKALKADDAKTVVRKKEILDSALGVLDNLINYLERLL